MPIIIPAAVAVTAVVPSTLPTAIAGSMMTAAIFKIFSTVDSIPDVCCWVLVFSISEKIKASV